MFFRYPGSKSKIKNKILSYFSDIDWQNKKIYCEPFFGSGAFGWYLMELMKQKKDKIIVVNDKDVGIYSLWKSVRDYPTDLIKLVKDYVPSVKDFDKFKQLDNISKKDTLTLGFRKLVLHQISYSGLGSKAGGPIGGKKQESKYKVGCRWNPVKICKGIQKCHDLMGMFDRFLVLNRDYVDVLKLLPTSSLVYLDPPYYVQGDALYKHFLSRSSHSRLVGLLKEARYSWVLSYDNVSDIKCMYKWATINEFEMTPTISVASESRKQIKELVIKPKFISPTSI